MWRDRPSPERETSAIVPARRNVCVSGGPVLGRSVRRTLKLKEPDLVQRQRQGASDGGPMHSWSLPSRTSLASDGEGRCTVEVRGFDSYNPAGQPTHRGVEVIEWFMVDTDYDGSAFFARELRFPGQAEDRRLKCLNTALGAQLDPTQRAICLSAKSDAFAGRLRWTPFSGSAAGLGRPSNLPWAAAGRPGCHRRSRGAGA